ncbi:unnamed protein product [Parajaminaea phylloscopi]
MSRVKMTVVTPATMTPASRTRPLPHSSHPASTTTAQSASHLTPRSNAFSPASHHRSVASSHSPSAADTAAQGQSGKGRRRRVGPCSPPSSGWDNYVYAVSLGAGLGVGMTLFSLLRERVYAEAAPASPQSDASPSSKRPEFGLKDVTLVCLVGVPKSGKSTQAKKLPQRFEGFTVVDGAADDFDASTLARKVRAMRGGDRGGKSKEGKEALVVLDGYPRTLEQAREIEQSLCPIFVVLYFDLPRDVFQQRFTSGPKAEQLWDPAAKQLGPLVDHFRSRGNILEISANWDSHEEVWEQVEAKVEQVLELKAMGEDVSVSP